MLPFQDKLKNEGVKIEHEIKKRVAGYIAGALGLVAGLAWNEAIQALLTQLFPLQKDTVLAKFIYAAVLTLVVVIVAIYIVRFFEEKKEK